MGRLPYQVLVILYLQEEKDVKYCVFERTTPKGQFQFIAGGGEDGETPVQTAVRETFEESGLNDVEFQALTSLCCIPTNVFSREQRSIWGKNTLVIPEYSFGGKAKSDQIKISDEHIGFHWVNYDKALDLLKWDSNKTALYELDCKLKMKWEPPCRD